MDKFNPVKMVAGLATGTHWAKTIMFSLSAGFLIFIGLGVYRGYFKKAEPTTEQKAKRIENYYHQPRVTFGCAHWKGTEIPVNRM
jgi:thiosulfate reductase cytochrome b subunit